MCRVWCQGDGQRAILWGGGSLPPLCWQDDGVVRVAGDTLLHGTQLTQSTTDPRDMGWAGDTQWYNTASDKHQGGARMHTHRHGEIYIDMYIYTHTQTDTAAAGQHVCEARGVCSHWRQFDSSVWNREHQH